MEKRKMKELLNEGQAARLLGLQVATLRRWRWAGRGPAHLKIGSSVRYDPAELDAFLAAARRTSTSDRPEAA
jgi:predicted DNA-binding transcriptional regulator AlpA